MMKRYKLLLALALSLLVFWPLGGIKADTANQPPESANQSEQISAAVATDSSDSGAGARGTPSQDSQIAAKALTVSDASAVAATETAASSQAANAEKRQLSLQKFPLLPIKLKVRRRLMRHQLLRECRSLWRI